MSNDHMSSQIVRLSQNIAGVTLLALGNGAPDIFSALAGIGQVMKISLIWIKMILDSLEGSPGAGIRVSVRGGGVCHGLRGWLCGLHSTLPLDGETLPQGRQLLPLVWLLGFLHLLLSADPPH